jgi:hypothetical protein
MATEDMFFQLRCPFVDQARIDLYCILTVVRPLHSHIHSEQQFRVDADGKPITMVRSLNTPLLTSLFELCHSKP